ncbi:MAG: CpsB/CapC family capsule biosynthesis tyrosine phosphatase [Candidatus Izemoplasmatales bacterium]|nr:CpsB/CapC family capsule biosynthesis tyrosine phosphatase [Candidatus Izemoplasmatales bacterium]
MIDVHSHPIPFIDDGSPSMEASIALLEDAVKQGVKVMFCTPHYIKSRNYLSVYEDNVVVFEQLQQLVKQIGIPIELYLGTEIYYSLDSIKDLREKRVVPIGATNRVLLEFHETEEQEDIAEAIHNMKALKLVPIIAHIERYSYINKVEHLQIIKKMGGLIQVNASSVLGRSGKVDQRILLKWMKLGLIDFIASDVHVFRKNDLLEAYRFVEKKLGKAIADKLCNNPAAFQ